MKLGIIGLARSGKTTIFNALTHRSGESPTGGAKAALVQVWSRLEIRGWSG